MRKESKSIKIALSNISRSKKYATIEEKQARARQLGLYQRMENLASLSASYVENYPDGKNIALNNLNDLLRIVTDLHSKGYESETEMADLTKRSLEVMNEDLVNELYQQYGDEYLEYIGTKWGEIQEVVQEITIRVYSTHDEDSRNKGELENYCQKLYNLLMYKP